MKTKASCAKKLAHFLFVVLSFLLIWQIDFLSNPWLKAILLMAWFTFSLIDLSRTFLLGTDISITAAYLLFYVGALLGCLFLVWIGNIVLRVSNLLFIYLEWEFRIGTLFTGIWYHLFSWPSLFSGLILCLAALLWENDVQYHAWHLALTKSLRIAKN